MNTYTDDYEKMAELAAGNWKKFDSFAWHYKPSPHPEDWCVVYTDNRDSGLLDQSNAAAIAKEMQPFIDDCTARSESHNHWACGYVNGYAIQVYTEDRQITEAFKKWCEIQGDLESYPVLDDSDYSEREYNATCENIEQVADRVWGKVDTSTELPDDYVGTLFDWFWANNQRAVENRDDSGGYPSEQDMEGAFLDLEWVKECPECGLVDSDHTHCANCQDAYDSAKGGMVHPIEGTRFCCHSCYVDGYTLKAV